jgi:hypothetical protein
MAGSVEQSEKRRKARAAAIALFGRVEGIPGTEGFLRLLVRLSQIAIWLGVLLLFVTPALLAAMWQGITKATADPVVKVFTILILFLVMLLCYRARKYHQGLYGFTEVILGLGGCWVGLGKTTDGQYAGSLAVVGGIYLGVRGITNILESYGGEASAPPVNRGSLSNVVTPEDILVSSIRRAKSSPPSAEYVPKFDQSDYVPKLDQSGISPSLLLGKPADIALILKAAELSKTPQHSNDKLKPPPTSVPSIPRFTEPDKPKPLENI